MAKWSPRSHARLMCGAASAALLLCASGAHAQANGKVEIAPQPLASALNEFGVQTGHQVIFAPALTGEKITRGVSTEGDIELALTQLLDGSGLTFRRDQDTFLIMRASDPQSGSAAGAGADAGTVQALVVTAQKREENIQDVPIAMSAFTQEDLTKSQVAGGPDLMTQVPNFTFTKTNFSGYSIQIRGIGTQAVSATVDPAVAVAFNNTPFIRNRFFEQEFYDLERVEVLRGPQGTLYGRNATAGVVNIISAKPNLHSFEAKLSADVSNYKSTRLEGMLNFPLADDKAALRIAGAWTKRDGYDTNQITGNPIDGRDLWSTRVSLRIEPTDKIRANLIWEHFQENDDRLRSGKQLCKKDTPTEVGGVPIPIPVNGGLAGDFVSTFSQGCKPTSLYGDEAFTTPFGFALPYYVPLSQIGLPVYRVDPYVSATQSRNLRVIESARDPQYKAKSDLGELQLQFDLPGGLQLSSETAYDSDFVFSLEDFNRFNTKPGAFAPSSDPAGVVDSNGVFCDPQIGCTDRLVLLDLSTAKSRQFSQEFRLSSDFDGPFNFSVGANFLRYDTEDKYYVFINTLSLWSFATSSAAPWRAPSIYVPNVSDNHQCLRNGWLAGDPLADQYITGCIYADPNPIGSLNDLGHNYFLSRNPYKLISYAAFGEAYYQITPTLKLTGGLRWTVDKKRAPRIPSWLIVADSVGYPVMEVVKQEWREPTGRLTLDWRPDLSFTDQTLFYGSYSHGYKAGGANPPPAVIANYGSIPGLLESIAAPKTFDPEFINAFEVGTKNTLLDGRLTLNADSFFYDYQGYQISQIVNRSAVNYNFDAKVWGAELEADWRPLENLKLGLKVGYEKTRMADGSKAIDMMDRTAGNPDWVAIRPFPTIPSNCVLPVWLVTFGGQLRGEPNSGGGNPGACTIAYMGHLDPVTKLPYVPNPTVVGSGMEHLVDWPNYPGFDPSSAPNNGEGFFKDLGGHELPNAPHFTTTVTTDYTIPLPSDWLMTLHSDFYYQSEAWTRVFNMPGYDKLKAYTNVNLAAIFSNEDAGWQVMAYVKNVFNKDNITGAFLNSDDTGLTTNVFLNEPRLYGLRVTKTWTGAPWWNVSGNTHPRGEPWPFTVELGGSVERVDAPNAVYTPVFVGYYPHIADFPLSAQQQDLDWGDGREVRLTYRPAAASWQVALGARFGRTNGDAKMTTKQVGPGGCVFAAPCDHSSSASLFTKYWSGPVNYGYTHVQDGEEHTLVDFQVGKDFGMGSQGVFDRSQVSLGLRYAQFKSRTQALLRGQPDATLPAENAIKYTNNQFHRGLATLAADREFTGFGPGLDWDASHPLWRAETAGQADLEWSLGAGVLFGKQRADIRQQEAITYYDTLVGPGGTARDPGTVVTHTPPDPHRSNSVTVPNLSASLGLSYSVDRVKVSAGYRIDRFYNVIDGGVTERKQEDRTIDGPYFKVSVGFGG